LTKHETKKRGQFVTFEGGEGTGKSTQVKRLASSLEAIGTDCHITREPGGTQGAEDIRRLLVEGAVERWDPASELLLHNAARVEHLAKTVRPALDAGVWVLCDRFTDSTMAYQGHGHGLDTTMVANLHWLLYGSFKPDLTLILDLKVNDALARTQSRNASETRYERMNQSFHDRVRLGFLEIAKAEPARCVVVDASGDIEEVERRIFEITREKLNQIQ